MLNLIKSEFIKLKRSKILIISFLGALVTPTMMFVDVLKIHYSNPEGIIKLASVFDSCLMYNMLLFGIIVCVLIGSYLFSREYAENTLKTILTIPISRTSLIVSKFITIFLLILGLMLISWCAMSVFNIIFNMFYGLNEFSQFIFIEYLIKTIIGGILMFLTISPFLSLAIITKGFIVPIISITTIVMGNVALINEDIGIFFPWTSTYLLLDGIVHDYNFYFIPIIVIIIVFLVGFISSTLYFNKEDIR